MDAVLIGARLALAAVFVVAATTKALDLRGTQESLRGFGVPTRYVAPGGFALPAAELIVVSLLLVPSAAHLGGVGAVALLGAFTAVLARALAAGDAPACHCFGQLSSAPMSRLTLARNAVLAVVGLVVAIGGAGTDGAAWVPAAVVVTATVVGVVASLRRLPGSFGGAVVGVTLGPEPRLLVFTSPGCGPCASFHQDVRRWHSSERSSMILLSSGAPPDIDGVRRETVDDDLRLKYGVQGTPGAVMVAGGRVVSRPALGAVDIDALARGWAAGDNPEEPSWHGLTVQAFGVEFAVAADTPGLTERAQAVLPPGTEIVGPLRSDIARWSLLTRAGSPRLYHDGVFAAMAGDERQLLDHLAASVRVHIAELAPAHTFVHAGVVAVNGQAIVIAGRSFSGKSTFVTALLRAGAQYMSDEFAVIDEDGLVHPFAKPISVREPGGFEQTDHDPGEFTDAGVVTSPLPLGVVVRAPFEAGADWAPVTATPGSGAMILVDNAVGIRQDPPRVLATIRRACEGALVLDKSRGDAESTAHALLAHLGGIHAVR